MHGQELWRSDGTEAGTSLVKDILPNAGRSRPRELTESGGELFLRADDGLHGDELWVSDGTEDGTSLVLDINTGGAFLGVHAGRTSTPRTGTLRVRAYFDGSGTLTVAPSRQGWDQEPASGRSRVGDGPAQRHVGADPRGEADAPRTGQVEVGAKFTFASCGGAIGA